MTLPNKFIAALLAILFLLLILFGAVSLRENNTWMEQHGIESEEESVYDAETASIWLVI